MKFQIPPENHPLASDILNAQVQSDAAKTEIGYMGALFGSATEKQGNIAGFAIIAFALMFIVAAIWGADTPSLSKKDLLTIIGGFITLTLGFVFGRSSST